MISNVERVIKKSLEDAKNEGLEKGLEKGLEEGLEKGFEKVAKQMLIDGENIERIIKYTGLSREKIEKLK